MPFIVVRNDIAKMEVDAIVNTTSSRSRMRNPRGAEFAVMSEGGKELIQARDHLGFIEPGDVKHTPGFGLLSDYVFHTVGPVFYDKETTEKELSQVYLNCLRLAEELELESIAFPLIASGRFKVPRDYALDIASDTISGFLTESDLTVYLVVFDHDSFSLSKHKFEYVKQVIDTGFVMLQKEKEDSIIDLMKRDTMMNKSISFEAFEEETVTDVDTFHEQLFIFIDEKDMRDPDVYKKANIDRRLFSKIRSDKYYVPSKRTVCALAIGLKLDIDETEKLLKSAGYYLSNSIQFDLIIKYSIINQMYNVYDINQILSNYHITLLGSQ
ncbi:MAG: macro domain-containing protein [Halanaerobiales bacterium]|nr:macro domain-containing protein [Halanaerobiales bacterium]